MRFWQGAARVRTTFRGRRRRAPSRSCPRWRAIRSRASIGSASSALRARMRIRSTYCTARNAAGSWLLRRRLSRRLRRGCMYRPPNSRAARFIPCTARTGRPPRRRSRRANWTPSFRRATARSPSRTGMSCTSASTARCIRPPLRRSRRMRGTGV